MKKVWMQALVFIALLVITFGTYVNPYKTNGHNITTFTALSKNAGDPLYNKIKMYAEAHHVEPINASINKVWKAIPGYNGLKVDIGASYTNMEKLNKFNEKNIVLNEVSPKIHLKDLPPAPVYKGNPQKPMVAFLINVAWGNDYIPKILKVLNKYHIKATFFLDGNWVKKNPDLAVMISEEGHEIGNHAYSHPDMSKLSLLEIQNEIKKTNQVIEATLDIKPKWFAPPSGSYNDQVVKVADQLGMRTIMWTVDTVDWKNPNSNQMVQRVLSKVDRGSMILMHPTAPTAMGLEQLISGIQHRGFQIGSVSQLFSEKRVQSHP